MIGEYLAVLVLAVALIVLIDAFTNDLDTKKYSWDFNYYKDMAENGIGPTNTNLKSPYVFRFISPLIAGLLQKSGIDAYKSFKIISYFGALSLLLLVYFFSSQAGGDMRTGFICLLTIGLSSIYVKFLQFDVFRPESLAYPLLVIAVWAAWKGYFKICLLISGIGLQCREFLIIPLILILLKTIVERQKLAKSIFVARMFFIFVVAVAVVIIPRILIHVHGSDQYIDFLHDPAAFIKLFTTPFHFWRDVNFVFSFFVALFPIMLLMTSRRLKLFLDQPKKLRHMILTYVFCVLVLAFYGGTDLNRFMSYLFIPVVFALTIIFKDEKIAVLELLMFFLALFIFNRILFSIPQSSKDAYLDFSPFYSSRFNMASVMRLVEMFLLILLMNLFRWKKRIPKSA
jgi:hypothetical protein